MKKLKDSLTTFLGETAGEAVPKVVFYIDKTQVLS